MIWLNSICKLLFLDIREKSQFNALIFSWAAQSSCCFEIIVHWGTVYIHGMWLAPSVFFPEMFDHWLLSFSQLNNPVASVPSFPSAIFSCSLAAPTIAKLVTCNFPPVWNVKQLEFPYLLVLSKYLNLGFHELPRATK